MKKVKFKEANSKCGYIYITNEHNSVIMKFKPTFIEILKMMIGKPVWIGAPIRTRHAAFSTHVTKTAFIGDDK